VEYVEYYRIIRERIWLVIVLGGIGFLAVIAMQAFVPKEYMAEGAIKVQDAAKVDITLRGRELTIGIPTDRTRLGAFWANLLLEASGRKLLDFTMRELGMAAQAADQYKVRLGASRAKSSDHVYMNCTTTDSELSLRVLGKTMELLCKAYTEWRTDEAQNVVTELEDRRKTLQDELARAQKAVSDFEQAQGGRSPVDERKSKIHALEIVEIALQSAGLELETTRERASALETYPTHARAGLQAASALYARIDDLNDQIMQRELTLQEMKAYRTDAHPDVLALEAQIGRLRERVARVEGQAKEARDSGAGVGEAIAAAQVAAAEVAKRREVLANRSAGLTRRLAEIQTALARYTVLQSDLEHLKTRYQQTEQNLAAARAEQAHRDAFGDMLEIAEEPRLNTKSSRKFILMLCVATGGGLGLGIVLVFVMHYVDTTFKNEEEAARLLGYPILAGIPHTDIEIVEETEVAPGDAPAPPEDAAE